MEQYWSTIQSKVCRKCIDGDGTGRCRLPVTSSCALQEFLPSIVETVHSLSSDSYEDYVLALRSKICSQCPDGSDGTCRKRDAVECALDRYYGLVLQVIENVKTVPVSLR